MRRTFNYTGRQKIPRTAVSINVYNHGTALWFDASLSLAHQKLPPDARVFVEAYYERAFARFDFGTVNGLKVPLNRSLEDIDFGRRVLFRVKVVDAVSGHGRVLAAADGLVPIDIDNKEGTRESLLEVDPRTDMGQEVWRVAITDSGPSLQVNASIEDVMSVFRNNAMVRSLVYPQVLRIVLSHAVQGLADSSDDSETEWQLRWTRFATRLCGCEPPVMKDEAANPEDIKLWIDGAVEAFSTKQKARDLFAAALAEEAS